MNDDLKRYFSSDYERLKRIAEESTMYGHRLENLSRDDLLVAIGFLMDNPDILRKQQDAALITGTDHG